MELLHSLLKYVFTFIWLANGLFCKVLNLVPRHQTIIATILGKKFAPHFTILIGCVEIIMAIWIISGYKSRLNALVQMALIVLMNSIEFILVPDLLLWGKLNAFFALLLIFTIYTNEYYLRPKLNIQT